MLFSDSNLVFSTTIVLQYCHENFEMLCHDLGVKWRQVAWRRAVARSEAVILFCY